MIVRNEAHIIRELLDAVAPYISTWVIVDTGSDDGTQDLITNHMAQLGIRGELYERPWQNFGHNRTEALSLAQGHADYIWVIDADDAVVGTPDFSQLSADAYFLRYKDAVSTLWRPQLFRNGASWHYKGVIHEYAVCDGPCVSARLAGEYHIGARSLGARSLDPQRFARDRDLLLAEVERNPEDTRSVFYLAQSYFDLGDFANARTWYARRVELGGWAEEAYIALYQVAESMSRLGAPWPEVLDAFLKAWEFRPTRSEPLYAIAHRYRTSARYRLGYLFARQAAETPYPQADVLLVRAEVYAWRALDEQAVCASWIGKHAEAFALWRSLLTNPDIPDEDLRRMVNNRIICARTMINTALSYPDAVVQSLLTRPHTAPDAAKVVVSLVAGPDRASTEHTVNSFLNCCTDVSRVERFLLLDDGLSAQDRAALQERYAFIEFADPSSDRNRVTQLVHLRAQIHAQYWLHLGQGWRFFAAESFIGRLIAVLQAEPHVFQVGINFTDADTLTGAYAAEDTVRRAPHAGRYVLSDAVANGPAMFDTTRLDQAGGFTATAGLPTASLDEILCVATV
ncbi:MAG: glycosyltransferase [Mycobacteriaceae bacterium]|nr:glycosyltransferase [Mycobacteriaceae bacterium]